MIRLSFTMDTHGCYPGVNWVTKVGGTANIPYFASSQRNRGIPDSRVAWF